MAHDTARVGWYRAEDREKWSELMKRFAVPSVLLEPAPKTDAPALATRAGGAARLVDDGGGGGDGGEQATEPTVVVVLDRGACREGETSRAVGVAWQMH